MSFYIEWFENKKEIRRVMLIKITDIQYKQPYNQ